MWFAGTCHSANLCRHRAPQSAAGAARGQFSTLLLWKRCRISDGQVSCRQSSGRRIEELGTGAGCLPDGRSATSAVSALLPFFRHAHHTPIVAWTVVAAVL